jgi:AraC-like DNA-binding protein
LTPSCRAAILHRVADAIHRFMDTLQITTDNLQASGKAGLVRDAAFNLFNLEADLEGVEEDQVHATIDVQRGSAMSVVDVSTCWSVVRRTPARAAAATSDDLMLYTIGQGGSWFRNGRDEQFLTRQGSVVLGSQAAPYTGAAAAGKDWRFRAVRVDGGRLPLSGERIRRGGFQLLPEGTAMARLAADHLASLGRHGLSLEAAELDAGLQALDVLLAACLGDGTAALEDGGAAIHAARFAAARGYVEKWLSQPQLSPELVARHLGISTRQLHRIFAREGTSVAAEIRRVRVERARVLLARDVVRPVTEIALACGFDSLPTFYRCFRAVTGMTATEWRSSCVT